MREPLDVKPEEYDLFIEAFQAVDEGGIRFDNDEMDNLGVEELFDDEEYASEEDDFPEGLEFGENYSEASTDDEELLPNDVDGETENRLPIENGGTARCPICGRQ